MLPYMDLAALHDLGIDEGPPRNTKTGQYSNRPHLVQRAKRW